MYNNEGIKERILSDESFAIIGACMAVHRELGHGFLEAIYQEALAIEFNLRNIPFVREKKLQVIYKDQILEKCYYADFICYDDIILELKATNSLEPIHEGQLINYLNATNHRVGLLINFGQPSLQQKRVLNKNIRKHDKERLPADYSDYTD